MKPNEDSSSSSCWVSASSSNSDTFRPARLPPKAAAEAPPGFILGKGSLGYGYYAQETKDAYQILLTCMKNKVKYRQEQLQYYYDATVCCCGLGGKKYNTTSAQRATAVEQLHFAQHLVAVVQARLAAPGPFTPLTREAVEQQKMQKQQQQPGGSASPSLSSPPPPGINYTFEDLCEMSATKQVKRYKSHMEENAVHRIDFGGVGAAA